MSRLLPLMGLFAFFTLPLAVAGDGPVTTQKSIPESLEREIRVVALQHARAEVMSRQVSTAVGHTGTPQFGSLNALETMDTNSIILCGHPILVSRAVNLIKTLDVPATNTRQTRVLPLKHADLKETGILLAQIIVQKWPGRVGDWRPAVAVDERTRTLLLTGDTSGIEELLPIVERLDAAVE